jgi:hypothetical protein
MDSRFAALIPFLNVRESLPWKLILKAHNKVISENAPSDRAKKSIFPKPHEMK